ncbi:unnamed protein product [Adineta ricciae]|uniref:Uncharacterized protein n=1 Tax=Adineta ricciae TaxID=249248 RepID=A0A813QC27_ADIRI|nr:unnamed protein product [Adineta ricciae]CAF1388918.1 unnamed protein product [Adineta ricciae]
MSNIISSLLLASPIIKSLFNITVGLLNGTTQLYDINDETSEMRIIFDKPVEKSSHHLTLSETQQNLNDFLDLLWNIPRTMIRESRTSLMSGECLQDIHDFRAGYYGKVPEILLIGDQGSYPIISYSRLPAAYPSNNNTTINNIQVAIHKIYPNTNSQDREKPQLGLEILEALGKELNETLFISTEN